MDYKQRHSGQTYFNIRQRENDVVVTINSGKQSKIKFWHKGRYHWMREQVGAVS